MANNTLLRSLITLASSSILFGCAGPATPLGGVWTLNLPSAQEIPLDLVRRVSTSAPKIRFTPKKQVWHAPRRISIHIDDPDGIPEDYKLRIRYNGVEVTAAFLSQSELIYSNANQSLEIKAPDIRLLPAWENEIEVVYFRGYQAVAKAQYANPSCNAYETRFVATTESFPAGSDLLRVIARLSKEKGFSPALITALIAQESGFNPRAVSPAKAIGLTQITPVADLEMTRMLPKWPRYPGISDYPFAVVKGLILTGEVNADNDWRLDARKSVMGGVTFMDYLSKRWNSAEGMGKIRGVYEQPTAEIITQLLLASYNSGFARVQARLNQHGQQWMEAPDLKAARKYVNRIFSFCEHFSNPEVMDENET